MPENYLHIWPRHKFIIIASANQNKSFNATLVLPMSIFNSLSKSEEILQFFQENFPDFLSFVGSDEIIKTFLSSKPRPFVTIKCSTYVSSNGDMLLMGDAAHSIAPFYAQGMNAAFEDCLILFETLEQTNFDIQKAFITYK
jgi:kynurenine 3-monooxygenase